MGEGVGGGGLGGFLGFSSGILGLVDFAATSTAINCSVTEAGTQRLLTVRPDPYGNAPYSDAEWANLLRAVVRNDTQPGDPCGRKARLLARAEELSPMGFLDDLVGGIKGIGSAIGAAVPVVISGVKAYQAVQGVLNGSSGGNAAAAAAAAMPMAMEMAMGGGAATQGSASQAAFAAACNADPTGQCQAAIAAALAGGGRMDPMMLNGDVTEAGLIAAGVPASLVMLLRGGGQAALNALRQLVPGLAVGAAGAAIGTALTTPSAMSSGARYPRSIFIPDARGGTREYKYRGRPVLYSGDIATAKRVVKVAKRARSARSTSRRTSRAAQILMLPAGSVTACGKCGSGSCSGC